MKATFFSLIVIPLLFTTGFGQNIQNPFLLESDHLDFNHSIFDSVLHCLVKREDLTQKKLEKIFYYIRDSIPFANDGSLKSSEALTKKKALCYTKSMIFVSFCRKLGIPAVLSAERFYIKADLPNADYQYHGIARILVNERWIYIDVVSNKDVWYNWWAKNKLVDFKSPVFSLVNNVVVDSSFVDDLRFEDYSTNDVPQKWLDDMVRFIKTGKW